MNTMGTLPSRQAGILRAGLLAVLTLGAWAAIPSGVRADTRVSVGVGVEMGLPRGYTEVMVGRERYYTHRGVYYQRGPRGYVVVRAPRGAFVRALPPHPTRIYVGNSVYYRYGDVYYQTAPGGYVVVDAPPTTVSVPPTPAVEEYQSVWVGQKEYLFKDGQFFVKTPEGVVWVEAPLGAMTKLLPNDAHSVWYQGIEYFESDDVFFRKTPDGYQVVNAPWKVPVPQIPAPAPAGVVVPTTPAPPAGP